MNKKIEQVLNQWSLDITKNSAYGLLEGYEINVVYQSIQWNNTFYPVRIHISCYATEDVKKKIQQTIMAASIKHLNCEFTNYGILIGINDLTIGRLAGRLDEIVKQVLNVIKDHDGLGAQYCPVCGELLDIATAKKCQMDGYTITLDSNCVSTINAVIEQENKDLDNAPNNYLMGFLGACVGGLAGAIIAFILNLVGFISALSAAVAAVLGSFLYLKFGGKKNKMMIVIVTITTLVFMVLSVLVVYIVAAGIAAHEENLDIRALDAFKICMQYDEFSKMFILDMILTILFSILGVSYQVYQLFKVTKRQKQI